MAERTKAVAPMNPPRVVACCALRREGRSYESIAKELDVSWVTVRRYIRRWDAWYEQQIADRAKVAK